MRKIFRKIVCFTVAAASALGVFSLAACGDTYKSKALDGDYSTGTVNSNGGFAVQKGNYIYFINGKEDNTADNTYGKVVKGAIMRISKNDLAARNYSSVQTVVPQIVYSGNSNAGIYVYDDYVYYATPSTEKNSDGEVQNSYLEFRRTKLDGTETMKNYYAQSADNSIEYRYVQDGDNVYLLYVTSGEKLYGEDTGVSNLHSVNTKTNEDTVLAYNVDSVTFDSNDVTNPRIYYTMNVTDFRVGSTPNSKYNQIYTVTASAKPKYATGAKDYTEYLTKAFEDDEDGYNPEKNPRYLNCGELVLDGIGVVTDAELLVTPFNGAGADKVSRSAYKYSVSSYQSGNLFYTRTSSSLGASNELYNVKESKILADGWNPIEGNAAPYDDYFAEDSSDSFTYIFDGEDIKDVFISKGNGLVKTVVKDNKVVIEYDNKSTFYMTQDGNAKILFSDSTNKYIYYTLSKSANGYTVNGATINRIKYDGTYDQYFINVFPEDESYLPVCVLDLDASVDWYQPELFENQLLFPSVTENMSGFGYIMACDLNDGEGKILDNAGIKALNEKYKGVLDKINETDATVYENLPNAYRYGFYADESKYIDELIKAYADIMNYDEEHFWSKESVAKFKDYVAVKGDWAEYAEDTVKVNGNDIAANKHDYYYSLLGKMTDEDAEAYTELLKTNYLQAYPEKEPTWFESLTNGQKAGFIIGVVLGGLLVIAAAVVVPLLIIRKRKSKLPVYKKKRIKVDTTDDKNIDVYSDGQE